MEIEYYKNDELLDLTVIEQNKGSIDKLARDNERKESHPGGWVIAQ